MFGSGPLTVLGGVEVGNNFTSQSLPNIYEKDGSLRDVCIHQGLAWVPTKFTNKSKDWPGEVLDYNILLHE